MAFFRSRTPAPAGLQHCGFCPRAGRRLVTAEAARILA